MPFPIQVNQLLKEETMLQYHFIVVLILHVKECVSAVRLPPAEPAQDFLPSAIRAQPCFLRDLGSPPRLRDAAVTFLSAGSTSNEAQHTDRHGHASWTLPWQVAQTAADKVLPSTASAYKMCRIQAQTA